MTVKPGQTDTLDIAVPDAGCFAQIDLYRGAVKFDGKLDAKDGFVHGDLPKGPDRPVIKDKLIAAWNGGTKDCTVTEQPPSSPLGRGRFVAVAVRLDPVGAVEALGAVGTFRVGVREHVSVAVRAGVEHADPVRVRVDERTGPHAERWRR